MNAAELINVSYIYSDKTPFMKIAADSVTLAFEEGLTTGLIGHTGCGKSTVAQLINGLLRPSGGEVRIFGKNIWSEPKKIKEIRFKVGLVFQYPEYQLFEETVEKDISFGPKNMGLSDAEIKERVLSAADFAGLGRELLSKSPFELSGGQRRRAAVAGVMAMRPDILILDEPAAGLDPRGRKEILGNIASYKKETGSTVIMISHSMEDMAEYCDRLLVMNEGKQYLYGTCAEVFSRSEELESVGLSVPQATKLLCELKKRGYDVNTSVYTAAGAEEEIRKLRRSLVC